MHIHKTGGTSLEQVFLSDQRAMTNLRHPDEVRSFLALPPATRDSLEGVYGHMPFGIHRYVDRPVSYMTFLRDPVDRVLSAYAHNLRHSDEPGAEDIRKLGLAWTARPLNFMCRILGDYDLLETPDNQGRFWWNGGPDFVPRSFLEQAKANLERCAFIGLTETYDEDIRALADLPDHPIAAPPVIPRAKVSGSERLDRAQLPAEALAAIEAANRLDIELYEHALRLRDAWGGPLRREGAFIAPARQLERPTATSEARCRRRAPAELAWKRLPSQTPLGEAPVTLEVDVPVYAYAAATGLLPALHGILELKVEARSGAAGFMLTSPDGAETLGAEQIVSPRDGASMLRFTLAPHLAPAILVVRNGDPDGVPGRVVVRSAHLSPPQADATAAEPRPQSRFSRLWDRLRA